MREVKEKSRTCVEKWGANWIFGATPQSSMNLSVGQATAAVSFLAGFPALVERMALTVAIMSCLSFSTKFGRDGKIGVPGFALVYSLTGTEN